MHFSIAPPSRPTTTDAPRRDQHQHQRLRRLALVLHLRAHLPDEDGRLVRLPAAVIVQLAAPSPRLPAGGCPRHSRLTVAGALRLRQPAESAVDEDDDDADGSVWPRWLIGGGGGGAVRQPKQTTADRASWFRNWTAAADLGPAAWRRRLAAQPLHLAFVADDDDDDQVDKCGRDTRWSKRGDGDGGRLAIEVRVRVPPVRRRRRLTAVQRALLVWPQLAAVAALVAAGGWWLVAVAFGRRWVRAWEVAPGGQRGY